MSTIVDAVQINNKSHLKFGVMDKQTEIKTLQSLKGDSYFGMFFKYQDIDQMCENIKNDYPIEIGCLFNKKAEVLEKQLHDEQKAHDKDMLNLAEQMITEEAAGGIAVNIIERKIGMANTIRIKRKNKIALSEEEIDYLVSKLD